MLGYFSMGTIYGLYRNNGKENENYYTCSRVYVGAI